MEIAKQLNFENGSWISYLCVTFLFSPFESWSYLSLDSKVIIILLNYMKMCDFRFWKREAICRLWKEMGCEDLLSLYLTSEIVSCLFLIFFFFTSTENGDVNLKNHSLQDYQHPGWDPWETFLWWTTNISDGLILVILPLPSPSTKVKRGEGSLLELLHCQSTSPSVRLSVHLDCVWAMSADPQNLF